MIITKKELCPQNHACPVIRHCPVDAITQDGYAAPKVNNEKCIMCCKCTARCGVFVPIGCCGDGEDTRM